ncbi:jg21827 [Pararge aegeria aegeria]|uniref:Jg21827 protein n=1 Tax=Pararge aegeria aegeria TaxID=348720 RepID=A0A8S4QNK3_9NEOP|nr:jg21827 [Pararge aegeria aegeria]
MVVMVLGVVVVEVKKTILNLVLQLLRNHMRTESVVVVAVVMAHTLHKCLRLVGLVVVKVYQKILVIVVVFLDVVMKTILNLAFELLKNHLRMESFVGVALVMKHTLYQCLMSKHN